jgi:hypothetical protein
MLHWKQLVMLPEDELARLDIALVNLACAADLPDAPGPVVWEACIKRLDHWASLIGGYTERLLPKFRRSPHEYEHSEAYFRMLCLATVLQRDCGVRYNPAKVSPDVPLDTADSFIHGAVLGEGGTCCSLPVVWAAVGRRLGYPLKLVSCLSEKFSHLFLRWEGPGSRKRFNIEATTHLGFATPSDDDFRTGRFARTAQF